MNRYPRSSVLLFPITCCDLHFTDYMHCQLREKLNMFVFCVVMKLVLIMTSSTLVSVVRDVMSSCVLNDVCANECSSEWRPRVML